MAAAEVAVSFYKVFSVLRRGVILLSCFLNEATKDIILFVHGSYHLSCLPFPWDCRLREPRFIRPILFPLCEEERLPSQMKVCLGHNSSQPSSPTRTRTPSKLSALLRRSRNSGPHTIFFADQTIYRLQQITTFLGRVSNQLGRIRPMQKEANGSFVCQKDSQVVTGKKSFWLSLEGNLLVSQKLRSVV